MKEKYFKKNLTLKKIIKKAKDVKQNVNDFLDEHKLSQTNFSVVKKYIFPEGHNGCNVTVQFTEAYLKIINDEDINFIKLGFKISMGYSYDSYLLRLSSDDSTLVYTEVMKYCKEEEVDDI